MSAAFTVVFRAQRQAECEERAFMLMAVSIGAVVGVDGADWVVRVDSADADRAVAQLQRYEIERRVPARMPAPPPLPVQPQAWVGSLLYALILIAIGLLISNGVWRLDAFSLGELDAARVQAGQWWRVLTALTLHLDGAHLVGNLAAGSWFGYLAARQLGAGSAWLLGVIGAALANLIEALAGPPSHLSVGASTAVFTLLGLLSAHAWRLQYSRAQRWALQWAPLVGGVVLLGWFGAGTGGSDDTTDIVAHALGFVIGALLGVLAARPALTQWFTRMPQWLPGALALALIGSAWALALSR